MRDILSEEMHAFIVLVDSYDRERLLQAKRLIRILRRTRRVPYLVVANKQDVDNSLSIETIGRALKLDGKTPVIPCVATDKASVRTVLRELKALMD
jgi:hypothetical protein